MIGERYRLHEQIGAGGMATVWRATDTLLGRQVAVKRPIPHRLTPAAEQRFRREAQAAARLGHPGILTVFDAGEDDEGPWLVMELIRGTTLADLIRRDGPLSPTLVVSIAEQAAAALDHAHELGIVHRDVKPSNLIVEPDGRVRLADFGIARPVAETATITTTGEVVGTVAYMAPELVRGGKATPASDVYSLGAVVYEMLAGTPPFTGSTTGDLLGRIAAGDAEPLPTTVPRALAAAVSSAMARDPADRPATASEFASRLTRDQTLVLAAESATVAGSAPPPTGPVETTVVVPGRPPARRRRRRRMLPWVVAALVAVAATMAVIAADDDDDDDTVAATTTSPEGRAQVGATTTTAAPSANDATTSTAPATTSTATTTTSAVTAQTIASEIVALVDGLRPPDFHPRDIERVDDRLGEFLRDWDRGDMGDAEKGLRRLVSAVDDLGRSDERATLLGLIDDLAELLDLEMEDEDDDD